MQLYTMQLLNTRGDITIGWTEDQADMMIGIIEQKMKEGYTFFILEDNDRQVRLRTSDELKKTNSVIIGDKEAELLIKDGKIGLVEIINDQPEEDIKTTTRAKTAKEVATGNTVRVSPKAGG